MSDLNGGLLFRGNRQPSNLSDFSCSSQFAACAQPAPQPAPQDPGSDGHKFSGLPYFPLGYNLPAQHSSAGQSLTQPTCPSPVSFPGGKNRPPGHQPAIPKPSEFRHDAQKLVRPASQDLPDAPHHRLSGPPPGQPYPAMEPHINGGMPNGMPYNPSEQYVVGGPVGYTSAAASTYPQNPGNPPAPPSGAALPLKKKLRAIQACSNCRQRKQKCDEYRPCGYCKSENLECQYREVLPPKTDRHMQQILEQSRDTAEQTRDTADRVSRLENTLQHIIGLLSGHTDPKQPQSLSPAQEPSNVQMTQFIPEGANIQTTQFIPTEDSSDNKSTKNVDQPVRIEDEPPSSHETGAQYLMKWPRIRGYFARAKVFVQEYVFDDTEKAGTLRPYGYSLVEGGQIVHFSNAEINYEDHDPQDPARGFWGDGTMMRDYSLGTAIGGNNPDGSLALDDATVRTLYDSYMRNMWIMHPFLDAKWLRTKVDRFIEEHSPIVPHPRQPDILGSATGKRKRPSNVSEDTMDLSESSSQWQRPKKEPERSMENAIVLLVLAIGKVLSETGFLLDSLSRNSYKSSEGSDANSPLDATRPYPRSYGQYDAACSPKDFKSALMARGSSLDRSRSKGKKIANVELFPGLAYFAQAVSTLGLNLGGNEIIHAQAFLLAGIYFGQLGRVKESWSWIDEACRVTTVLESQKKFQTKLLKVDQLQVTQHLDQQCTLIATLCWSALQLESDIRAELDQLPKPSQLMFMEPKIARPGCPAGVQLTEQFPLYSGPALPIRDIHMSYLFQVELRLTLNRVHAALYSRKTTDVFRSQKKNTTAVWSDSNTSGLFLQLQGIRQVLRDSSPYGWTDDEDPADQILAARLRAKYYGGEYIILRPYIFNALQWQGDLEGGPRTSVNFQDWLNKYTESAKRAANDRAASEDYRLPEKEITIQGFQTDPNIAEQFLWCCKRCIDAAMYSTKAFDGVADPLVGERLRVTNIFGTATAQFSNMLVLSAIASSWLHWMVDKSALQHLMHRTITLFEKLSPLGSIFETNLTILRMAAEDLYNPKMKQEVQTSHSKVGWEPAQWLHES